MPYTPADCIALSTSPRMQLTGANGFQFMFLKAPSARESVAAHPASELEDRSLSSPHLEPPPSGRGVLAPELRPAVTLSPVCGTGDEWSPPAPPPANAFTPQGSCAGADASIPLHLPPPQHSITAARVASMVPMIMAIINMAVVTLHIHSASLEGTRAHISSRKKSKRGVLTRMCALSTRRSRNMKRRTTICLTHTKNNFMTS